jgi:hypothetical protein
MFTSITTPTAKIRQPFSRDSTVGGERDEHFTKEASKEGPFGGGMKRLVHAVRPAQPAFTAAPGAHTLGDVF